MPSPNPELQAARRGVAPSDQWLEQALRTDWRAVFSLRVHHLEQLRRLVTTLDDAHLQAKAAYGVAPGDVPYQVRARLYRDYYIEDSPAQMIGDTAIGALRRGDRAPLQRLLAERMLQPYELLKAWHEVSTLYGCVAGFPEMRHGEQQWLALMEDEPTRRAGGPELECINSYQLSGILEGQLAQEPSLRIHHDGVALLRANIRDRSIPATQLDPSVSVLLHHTDGAITIGEGRMPSADYDTADATMVDFDATMANWIPGIGAFEAHLRAGASSSSRARRYLSHRLLQLDGSPMSGHPDDLMPTI